MSVSPREFSLNTAKKFCLLDSCLILKPRKTRAPDEANILITQHSFVFMLFIGALYGNGSYFAVDPQYSANGYAKPDGKGHKRMYLAKVLVGDFTVGSAGLLTAPARNSGNSADLYDSVTDNMATPKMFVVFSDVQAYPEYIITFQ